MPLPISFETKKITLAPNITNTKIQKKQHYPDLRPNSPTTNKKQKNKSQSQKYTYKIAKKIQWKTKYGLPAAV